MQAVINLSGEGTRLRPLSCKRCAGMLPVCDKSIIKRTIELLKHHGIKDIVIITEYMSHELEEHLKDEEMSIQFVPSKGNETGFEACSHIADDTFLYMSKVVYTDFDLTEAISFHKKKHAAVTLLLQHSVKEGIITDKDGRVTRIEEKRMWNYLSGEQSTGIYILNRDALDAISKGEASDAMPSLVRSGLSIYTKNITGMCESIHDFASYMRANFAYLDREKSVYAKGIIVEDGAMVETGAILEGPCYVGRNTHVHKGVKVGAYSILGEGSILLEGANVKRSIIGRGCRIGKNATLRGCVLDGGVKVGEASTVYEQAVIGSDSEIGKSVLVKSFVKIWPEKNIEDGAIVSDNIMWGQKKRLKLYEKGKIEGIVNVDITPVFTALLGECAGMLFEGGEVAVSTDGSPSGAMLRDGIVSGLLGSGCSVKDFGEQPLPITRRGVAFYMFKGAVCINVYDKGGEDVAQITIIGKDGFDVDEEFRQKLERCFEKREFMYPTPGDIKECEYLFEYKLYYLKSIVGYKKKNRKKMKLLLSCPATWGRRLIASAMADFSCNVSMYAPPGGEATQPGAFREAIMLGGFDMGFILDSKCEKLTLVTPDCIIDEETYEALTSLIIMKKYSGTKIFVPDTASSVIDLLGEKYSCEIIRTKTAPVEIMRHMSGEEKSLSEQFVFRFDAVAAVILLVDYLSCEGMGISQLLEEIPPVNMSKEVVNIPKGEVDFIMSRIHEMEGAADSQDGVKITFDKGWVLVIPDMEKEVFHVVSEGANGEFARELCDFCVSKIMEE